jgi:hypothetical protein
MLSLMGPKLLEGTSSGKVEGLPKSASERRGRMLSCRARGAVTQDVHGPSNDC